MKIAPMLFNSDMVCALLDGRKTVTRRPIVSGAKSMQKRGECCIQHREPGDKWYGDYVWSMRDRMGTWQDYTHDNFMAKAPAQKGDLIWVRETFNADPDADHESWDNNVVSYYEWAGCGEKLSDIPNELKNDSHVIYSASSIQRSSWKWRPSIHMLRWASRLTLKVTDVRIERVKDITPQGAKDEGFNDWTGFAFTWSSIYFERGMGWDHNPYVWVIEFELIRENVDKYIERMGDK